jgi:uncharacterized protein YbjT (DUF2867 family)
MRMTESTAENRKPVPRHVLIFGATDRIGGPLADFLGREASSIRLRLSTSKAAKVPSLRACYPKADVVVADYLEVGSLKAAVQGVDGVFVLTPSGTDERIAMTNLVMALKTVDNIIQVIRLVGMQPEANARLIPQSLREHGLGLPIQHPIAKQILDNSGLPVTYLNCGATLMDNFSRWMAQGLRERRTLIWPERLIPYVAPEEVGEVAGRLFLSDNHRHIGQFHTMNNGHDILRFHQVADMMREVWNEPIAYDGSKAAFLAAYAFMGAERLEYLWNFFLYEQDNEVVWARNDFVERIIGRKPKTLREWLAEHRDAVLGPNLCVFSKLQRIE